MRRLYPPVVYVHERVARDPQALARVEKMMAVIETPEVVEGVEDTAPRPS